MGRLDILEPGKDWEDWQRYHSYGPFGAKKGPTRKSVNDARRTLMDAGFDTDYTGGNIYVWARVDKIDPDRFMRVTLGDVDDTETLDDDVFVNVDIGGRWLDHVDIATLYFPSIKAFLKAERQPRVKQPKPTRDISDAVLRGFGVREYDLESTGGPCTAFVDTIRSQAEDPYTGAKRDEIAGQAVVTATDTCLAPSRINHPVMLGIYGALRRPGPGVGAGGVGGVEYESGLILHFPTVRKLFRSLRRAGDWTAKPYE